MSASDLEKCKKKIEKEIEAQIEYTCFVELPDGTLCEQGYDGKEVYFICYDPNTGEITRKEKIEYGDKIYLPIWNDHVEKGLVFLPSWPEEYGSDKELTNEIRNFLDKWHEELDRFERELDVYYCLMTWIYRDILTVVPYRRKLGRWGKGKTCWGETLGAICYRGFVLAGCDTEAAIRRNFDLWKGTAIIDEADFSNSSLYSIIIKILNIGWSRLFGWYQKADENDPKKVIISDVFGPKLLMTRKPFQDVALESRCQTSIARENVGKIPLFRSKKFFEEALKIRNKLLMWRFRNYHRLKQRINEVLEDPDITKIVTGEELPDIRSRIKQIILPLLIIVEDEDLKKQIIDFARRFQEELRSIDPDEEFKDRVETALKELLQSAADVDASQASHASHSIYARPYHFVKKVRLKDISLRVEPELNDPHKISGVSKRVWRVLKEEYGDHVFKSTGGHTHETFVYFTDWLLERLQVEDEPDTYNMTRTTRMTRKGEICSACRRLKWPYVMAEDGKPYCMECYKRIFGGESRDVEMGEMSDKGESNVG
ncbi:hypothetical protein J7L13_00880 [bacterium]|nr:hypothetical protein [bacterium]